MKVLCIDDSPARKDGKPYGLCFGEIYTVTDVQDCPDGITHYELKEIGRNHYFGAFRFVRISDIDETELAKEREQLQTV